MIQRAVLAFSLLFCTLAFGADEPKWLTDARAREGKSMQPAELKSKDGAFKARIPAKVVGTIEKVEGSYSVELDIGGNSSIYCEVYPEGVDLANVLRVTLGNAVTEIEKSVGKIEVRALEGMDAGAHGAVPFIAPTWLYRAAASDGARIGVLKQFVMEKNRFGVYCAHDDVGYTRSFFAVTKAFADSLEVEGADAAPYYVEVAAASMSNMKIGVALTTLERDAEGDTKARQVMAMLLATDDGSVQSQDSTEITWLRPDATVINASHSDVSNGELQSSLSLKEDEGTWFVEGEIQGKEVKTTLPKDSKPGSWVEQAQQLRALFTQPNPVGREHTIDVWLSENPAKLTPAKTKILAKQGNKHFTARGEIGGITADLTLEKDTGMANVANLKLGPMSIKLERVYLSGSF